MANKYDSVASVIKGFNATVLAYRPVDFIGKEFNFKLFGNEVSCTNALLLPMKIMRCS